MTLTGIKFDDGRGGFASNCFPVRTLKKNTDDASGAWLEEYRTEQRRRFKAVLCAKPRDFEVIRKERKRAERDGTTIIPPVIDYQPDLEEEHILDGFFLMKHCCVEDPADLCSVKIDGKSLRDCTQEDFALFDNVAYVNAADNSLHVESFKHFPIIRELELPLNDVRHISLRIGDFPHLEMLDLSYNNLTSSDIPCLGLIPHLKVLHLTGNNLTGLPIDISKPYIVQTPEGVRKLLRFPRLEILLLDDNKFQDVTVFACLAGLKSLKHLNLSKNRLHSVPQLMLVEGRHVTKDIEPPSKSQRKSLSSNKGSDRVGSGAKKGILKSPWDSQLEVTNSSGFMRTQGDQDIQNSTTLAETSGAVSTKASQGSACYDTSGLTQSSEVVSPVGQSSDGGRNKPGLSESGVGAESNLAITATQSREEDGMADLASRDQSFTREDEGGANVDGVEVIIGTASQIGDAEDGAVSGGGAKVQDRRLSKRSVTFPEYQQPAGEDRTHSRLGIAGEDPHPSTVIVDLASAINGGTNTSSSNNRQGDASPHKSEKASGITTTETTTDRVQIVVHMQGTTDGPTAGTRDEGVSPVGSTTQSENVLPSRSNSIDDITKALSNIKETFNTDGLIDFMDLDLGKIDKEVSEKLSRERAADQKEDGEEWVEREEEVEVMEEKVEVSSYQEYPEDSDEPIPQPFPNLTYLDLSFNLIATEEALLSVVAWPVLSELIIHNNPLVKAHAGDPPILRRILHKQLGINIERKSPKPMVKPLIEIQQRPHRVVKTKIYPVPRCDVDKLLAIEAPARPLTTPSTGRRSPSKRDGPASPAGVVDRTAMSGLTPLPPIGQGAPLHETLEEEDEYDDDFDRSGSDQSPKEYDKNQPAFFMTQVEGEEVVQPRTSSANNNNITSHNNQSEKSAVPRPMSERYRGYEDLLNIDKDTLPKDIPMPKDLLGNVRALKYALEHPLIFRDSHVDLNQPQNAFNPWTRCQYPPPKPRKTKAEKAVDLLDEIRQRKTYEEMPLDEVLATTANKDSKAAKKLVQQIHVKSQAAMRKYVRAKTIMEVAINSTPAWKKFRRRQVTSLIRMFRKSIAKSV